MVVAALVVGTVAERLHRLSFRAPLDAGAFRRAVCDSLRKGRLEQATALVRAGLPGEAASVAWPVLDPDAPDEDRAVLAEEALLDVRDGVIRRMRPLRIGASVASALGFIGAAFEIWWIYHGNHGLRALEAGVVESEGLGHAVLAIAIGISTSSFALGSWTVLKGIAKERLAEARRMLASVEESLNRQGMA